uniref:lactonase family protein n=1 Tax=uncultured Polaribacter sp. TaxID=174711 RepID=UPI002601D663|nr:lactonase family protein [uncultured Polaribacter sp.]
MIKNSILFLITILFFCGCKTNSKENKTLLFVGSFTDKKPGEGIHIYEFNEETGNAILKFTLNSITNTSFQKLSSNGKFLYSVVDSQMKYNGKIAAFKVDINSVKIDLLNVQDCGGVNPAHLAIDKTGKYLTNSNYSDGSLSLFRINSNGSLSKNLQTLKFKDSSIIKSSQKSSHIHSSNFSPNNKYLFAHDLGADKIRKFTFNTSEEKLKNLQEIRVKPGSGPRHFTFHPNGRFGYGINELSGTIDAYQYKNGNLIWIEDYQTYQQKQNIYRAADIHISADGNFLYVSNREPKENSIVVFVINKENGKLQLIEHKDTGGIHPRNFAISPSEKFLLVANQFSNNIVIFKRDLKSGRLTKLTNQIIVNSPSSLQLYSY